MYQPENQQNTPKNTQACIRPCIRANTVRAQHPAREQDQLVCGNSAGSLPQLPKRDALELITLLVDVEFLA